MIRVLDKKIKCWLYLLFITSFQFSFAQEEMYKIQGNLSYRTWSENSGHSICKERFSLYIFEDGHKRKLLYEEHDFEYGKYLRETTKAKRMSFSVEAYVQREDFFGDCDGAEAELDEMPLSITPCKQYKSPVIRRGRATKLEIQILIYASPLHTLSPQKFSKGTQNTLLPIGTKIDLFAKAGFPSELYNYQYATKKEVIKRELSGGRYYYETKYNWKPLPSHLKKGNGETLSVSAEDIFGSEAEAFKHFGETVYFRVVSFDKDNHSVCSSSEIVPLNVATSAPKVIRYYIDPPKCPEDLGKATFVFDRALHPKENARLSLVQGSYSAGKFYPTGFPSASINSETIRKNLAQNKTIVIDKIAPLDASQAYQLQFFGDYQYNGKTNNTYSDGDEYNKTFQIVKIPPITAHTTPIHNLCYGEKGGKIQVYASGGTPPYAYSLNGQPRVAVSQSPFDIANLPAGNYSIEIFDSRGCKMQGTLSATITQPEEPITISNRDEGEESPLFFKKDVSGFGLKNGMIQAYIKGGTPSNLPHRERYWFTLENEKGNIIYTYKIDNSSQEYFIVRYDQLDKGTYTLTLHDGNYCSSETTVFIDEPDPLVVSISEKQPISCHPANEDPNNNPTLNRDGALLASVTGGVAPYRYQWFEQSAGTWQPLLAETEALLAQRSQGTYQVAIEDKNGNKTSGTFVLNFPAPLVLRVQSQEIPCTAPTSGTAQANVQGGTPPYTYQWSNGQTSATATGLSVGKYFVVVTDSKGCSVQSQVVLSYPQAPSIDSEQITPLTCHADTNASIVLTTSGGKGTVTHSWYDASGNKLTKGVSSDGKSIKNLSAGSYRIVLRDQSDCPAIEKTFEIVQPDKLALSLPQSITLCQGDEHIFDLSGQIASATYRWCDASGNELSASSTLTVKTAGEYFAEATSPKGCKAYAKTLVKESSQLLDIDFLVATTSYYDYTLKLINLSKKTDALQWQFPEEVVVIHQNDQEAEIRFLKEGTYSVGLKGRLGECQKTVKKWLFVEKDRIGVGQGTKVAKNIESFLIVPNPNAGAYQLHIKLNKVAPLKIRLIDLMGKVLSSSEESPTKNEFILDFNTPLSAGQYLILIEVEGDVLSQKMIVR